MPAIQGYSMDHYPLLTDFLIVLAVSIPVSMLFHRLKLPAIIGFLATGIIVGPGGAELIKDTEAVRSLAEIGVVLLLFSIGVEFSLKQLLTSGRRILAVSIAQVLVTVLIVVLICLVLRFPMYEAIVLGFLVSLSSTAIVLKILSDRGEIDAPHGRISVGVLLFQDLCVIPMMLILPALSGESFNPLQIGKQLLVAAATITALVLGAKFLVPHLLKQIVRLRNRDLFLLTILLLCLGTAYAGASMGLSLAIGAFIAGIVISESDYSHQILSDILPFRDTFNAIFFVSVGMLLDPAFLIQQWKISLAATAGIMVLKAFLIFVLLLRGRFSFRVSWIAAFYLAQVGEFSILMMELARNLELLTDAVHQSFLGSTVLSMFITPFLITAAAPAGIRIQRRLGPGKEEEVQGRPPAVRKDHLVIVGYGLNGRNLSRVVREIGIPFLVVELNDRLVREARADQVPVLFGDATRKEVLLAAGADQAKMVVIAISDAAATRHSTAVVRSMNPHAVILVRTRYVAEVEPLEKLGGNIVIPEEFETSIEIFARVLEEYGIPDHLIEQQIAVIRASGYGMLRGLSLTDERLLKLTELFLKSTVQQFVVGGSSPARNKTLRELDLRKHTGATIIAIVRGDDVTNNPAADFLLEENDILVLWGAHQQLADATRLLKAE